MKNDCGVITSMPLIALRGLVVFPGMQLHFDVGRTKSIQAVENAMKLDREVCLVAQVDFSDEDPETTCLYNIGCVARIKQIIRLHGDGVRVVAEGLYRAKVLNYTETKPCFVADVCEIYETIAKDCTTMRQRALIRAAQQAFARYAKVNPKLSDDIGITIAGAKNVSHLADYIAGNVPFPTECKQEVLEELNIVKRLEYVILGLGTESILMETEREIEDKVRAQMDENQREYYLREQLKAISEELYEDDNPQEEAEDYRKKIADLNLSPETNEKLYKETTRLSKMPSGSHEATVVRSYLDSVLDLPWGKKTKDKIDLKKAAAKLDRDHYGLKKVKQRILEMLAVRTVSPDIRGQIICLIGPPGVGKTSIARSIAECMGRKYVRISLGGVHDESDIRGHRRTYIGAMPGRIMDAVKQSKSQNPLILMDEIDKLGADYRGDPSAALLEALDPEQNVEFHDHYLEIPFDLSDVLFILTANTAETIPPALLDRMEIINITSYTREEKFKIAKRHLVTKQLKRHGMKPSVLKITDSAVYALIDFYTRESGVRNLEREIASLCRKGAKLLTEGEQKVTFKGNDLEKYLGVHKYKPEQLLKRDEVGVVNGLAWTSVGGEIMQLEAACFKGSGKIILTGSLGDVMKESAQAAVSYIRSKADNFCIPPDFYKDMDIHIHATEGAVPKDGPSAGTALTVALLSALSSTPVSRTVAMTGEITLRGRVLPIGGLNEKTMAAYKAGIKTVIVPKDNEPDLTELDPVVTENITFVTAETIDDVLPVAFTNDSYRHTSTPNAEHKSVMSLPKPAPAPTVPNYF